MLALAIFPVGKNRPRSFLAFLFFSLDSLAFSFSLSLSRKGEGDENTKFKRNASGRTAAQFSCRLADFRLSLSLSLLHPSYLARPFNLGNVTYKAFCGLIALSRAFVQLFHIGLLLFFCPLLVSSQLRPLRESHGDLNYDVIKAISDAYYASL